mmetsp:Transcript_10210/g.17576  ORF Transcript_10210/g.17576 Transcript_10210/m.17576 type:complete len:307 (+) Transcript_10210:168-1088(+)
MYNPTSTALYNNRKGCPLISSESEDDIVSGDVGPQVGVGGTGTGVYPPSVGHFDDGVQGDALPRGQLARQVHQVGVYHSQHRLVRDDEDGLLVALQLVHEGVDARDQVEIRFPAGVAIPDLVCLTHGCFVAGYLLYLLHRHALVLSGEDLIEIAVHAVRHLLPLAVVQNGVRDVLGTIDSALKRAGPQAGRHLLTILVSTNARLRKGSQMFGILLARRRESRIPSQLSEHIVITLAVACEVDGVLVCVDVGQKLHDSHRKVAAHLVGHHLLSVVKHLHVGEVILRSVFLHADVRSHIFPHLLGVLF